MALFVSNHALFSKRFEHPYEVGRMLKNGDYRAAILTLKCDNVTQSLAGRFYWCRFIYMIKPLATIEYTKKTLLTLLTVLRLLLACRQFDLHPHNPHFWSIPYMNPSGVETGIFRDN